MAAIYYKIESNRCPTGIYTYGALRVGDSEFAEIYNSHLKQLTFCYINNQDPIPLLPPEFTGYKDVGLHCHFTKNSELSTTCPNLDELIESAIKWFKLKLKSKPNPAGHGIENYIHRLKMHINTDLSFKD